MIIIRPMKMEDVDSVFAIECRGHIAPWGLDVFYNCILAEFDCRVIELLDDTTSTVKIVGYLVGKNTEQECHLLNICVDPDLQGQGFGQSLLEELIQSLQTSPITSIILEVRPSNKVALALYNKFKFTYIGIKEAYYNDGLGHTEDAWLLRKMIKL